MVLTGYMIKKNLWGWIKYCKTELSISNCPGGIECPIWFEAGRSSAEFKQIVRVLRKDLQLYGISQH